MAHMRHNWFFEKCDNKIYGNNFLLPLKPEDADEYCWFS